MTVHQRRPRSAWTSAKSESSLWAQWVAKDPSFLHVDREDSDQTGWMPRLIWVFAGRTLILLVLSCRSSYFLCNTHIVLLFYNFFPTVRLTALIPQWVLKLACKVLTSSPLLYLISKFNRSLWYFGNGLLCCISQASLKNIKFYSSFISLSKQRQWGIAWSVLSYFQTIINI